MDRIVGLGRDECNVQRALKADEQPRKSILQATRK